nr:MAG TPA: hypothetical protein [Caudoviricetes sp.]
MLVSSISMINEITKTLISKILCFFFANINYNNSFFRFYYAT